MARVDDLPDRLQDRLEQDLQRLAEEHDVPGASVAVLVGGEVVTATFGVANARTGVPVTPDTLFMIQSITKVITATLVMQLVDESLLRLDDPIRTVLPRFRTADGDLSGQISVRHLLTHTGGFEGDLWAATTCGADALQRFVEDLVTRAPQNSAPGERFSYCNAGFGVLGRVVEEAVRRYLAEPLGIDELAFSADEALAFRTAISHVRPDLGSAQRPSRNWAVMPPSNPAAGNQLAMSAGGLLAVARTHLADGRAPDGSVVLAATSARLMRERQVDHPAGAGATPSGHGLGWWLDRGELVEHGGGTIGTAALLRTSPRHGVAAVVLTNAESGAALADDLLEPWFAELSGVTPPTALPMPPVPALTFDSRPFLGRYANGQHQIEVARGDDGRLWLSDVPRGDSLDMACRAGITASTQRHEVRPLSGDTFMILDSTRTTSIGSVEFLARDHRGRGRFLFSGGRAVPRVD